MNTGQELRLEVYDCFTDRRFGGNVGGIVFDAAGLSETDMQNIAREINAPVTGFVTDRAGRDIRARFFMPAGEIAMCGHVTVGLFSHLASEGGPAVQDWILRAATGDVRIRTTSGPSGQARVMMQLALPVAFQTDVDPALLADALGLPPEAITSGAPVAGADAGLRHLFVQLENSDAVTDLTPDFARLKALSLACGVHTVACFAMEDPGAAGSLHVRDFCPAVGVDETPASGTTNGALAGYLLDHGLIPPESQSIRARQGGEIGRPSIILSELEVSGGQLTALHVGGSAVASLSGTIAPLATAMTP